MSISDYTAKIKSICHSLGSINVNVDDDEMVQVCLDDNLGERNPSFILQPSINVIG